MKKIMINAGSVMTAIVAVILFMFTYNAVFGTMLSAYVDAFTMKMTDYIVVHNILRYAGYGLIAVVAVTTYKKMRRILNKD